ncbi:MAG: maltose alpha-D-glucosyltransferase [Acidimicrobiia bacterium]|nr:maltose alpha-D-glucosyltransferase [Acidimicrobiia bacterium]
MRTLPPVTKVPWFKTAVFYEVPVYAFADSNGDGVGDFAGLTERLDYLQWLGVDCLWVLPFFPSPLRDGGYDVSDFTSVDPRYGTLDDVQRFIEAAHQRGLRVISDMIVNHTSDAHPWFQAARQPDSPMKDWYVWSDDIAQWSEARVIFIDTHDSNWSWDPVAGRYFWHRFFDHQPDLNFDNPEVREAIKDVVRFWLDIGFDGLRLDAVPYLFERDGTNGENLPETHAYLKELRAMVDDEYPDKILLAEANQWPVDVVPYFGDGDECHMAFNFPVMPRLYMAVAQQDASSVIDILQQTPAIPESAQWGVFLRNHDELTLEMVSDTDREYMYARYAPDPAMKKNVGIRRRLAPLMDNDRQRIELLIGILLSLPGSPILYYGDEIGMGDIYLLNDRDGVRTPMQWDDSPGAGFSADPSAPTYLPIVDMPGYGPADVNVVGQQMDPHSLLSWVREILALRQRLPVMGTGDFVHAPADNPAVLSFERTDESQRVLVVANLSASPVTVNLKRRLETLTAMRGVAITDLETVSLPSYGFDWLVELPPE